MKITNENRLLALMSLTFGVLFFDRLSLNYLAPYVAKDLNLSNTQLGLLAATLALAWATSGYFLTTWAERNHRRKLVFITVTILFSLCSIASAFAYSFVGLFLARLLMGFSEGPVLPMAQTYMVEASSEKRKGFNMGLLQSFGANFFGSILAPMALIPLAEKYGWRSAFFIAGVPGLLLALLNWIYLKDAKTTSTTADESLPIKQLLGIKNIRISIIMAASLMAWMFCVLPFITRYFAENQHLNAPTITFIMVLLGISTTLAGIFVPALSDKIGRKKALLIFLAIGIFFCPAFMYLQGSSIYYVAIFVTYFGMGCLPLVLATVPAEAVPLHSVAKAIGLVMGIAEIMGGVIAPAIGGWIADKINPEAPFWLATICICIGLIAALFLEENSLKTYKKGV